MVRWLLICRFLVPLALAFRMAAQAPAPAGQQLFSSVCAGCHGLDGRGGEHAPDIAANANVRRLSDVGIAHIIRDGIPAAGMPAFSARFNSAQIDIVVKYLRSLQGQGGGATAKGNTGHGRELFFGKAGCSGCHLMEGQGGFLASDLSGFGLSHSAEDIRTAIVDPNRNLDPRNRAVTAISRDGQKYTGVLRNEDNFSLQMQTADGTFHLFDKSDLTGIEHLNRSMMPTQYGSELSKTDLDDLIAYLKGSAKADGSQEDEEE